MLHKMLEMKEIEIDVTLTGEATLNNWHGIGSLDILNYKYAVGLSPDF